MSLRYEKPKRPVCPKVADGMCCIVQAASPCGKLSECRKVQMQLPIAGLKMECKRRLCVVSSSPHRGAADSIIERKVLESSECPTTRSSHSLRRISGVSCRTATWLNMPPQQCSTRKTEKPSWDWRVHVPEKRRCSRLMGGKWPAQKRSGLMHESSASEA